MMPIELSPSLRQDEQGIWIAEKQEKLSYPDDGNESCFLVEDRSFWFQHRNNCIIAMIKQFPPDGTILDVGGGNGFVTKRLLDEGFSAVLLEPGLTGARNAKRYRQIPNVICATLDAAVFSDGSLSVIGCFDVIEHIESDRDFIKTAHCLLKSDGMFYGTVPAYNWLWSSSDASAGHYRRYDFKMLNRLFAGYFELLYFTYFFQILVLPVFLLRTLPFRFKLLKKTSMLNNDSEHGVRGGKLVKLINYFLNNELTAIQSGKTLCIESSCLFVCRKK